MTNLLARISNRLVWMNPGWRYVIGAVIGSSVTTLVVLLIK